MQIFKIDTPIIVRDLKAIAQTILDMPESNNAVCESLTADWVDSCEFPVVGWYVDDS